MEQENVCHASFFIPLQFILVKFDTDFNIKTEYKKNPII